jgi:hypothetical protein
MDIMNHITEMVIFVLDIYIKMEKLDGDYIKYYMNVKIMFKCYYKNNKK